MPASPLSFPPGELVALDTIREQRPEVVAALSERLARVLDDLARTCQGWVVTAIEADDLLDRLRTEFVGRMLAETDPWGEDEDLREPVVNLLSRHLLAEAGKGFARRVIVAKRN